jgi:hypothetical protein
MHLFGCLLVCVYLHPNVCTLVSFGQDNMKPIDLKDQFNLAHMGTPTCVSLTTSVSSIYMTQLMPAHIDLPWHFTLSTSIVRERSPPICDFTLVHIPQELPEINPIRILFLLTTQRCADASYNDRQLIPMLIRHLLSIRQSRVKRGRTLEGSELIIDLLPLGTMVNLGTLILRHTLYFNITITVIKYPSSPAKERLLCQWFGKTIS